jgi:hypothetical protein
MALEEAAPHSYNGRAGDKEMVAVRILVKLLVSMGLAIVALAGGAVQAGAAIPVGPHQYFTGVVNGVDGSTVDPISIQMDCFGPVTPGETGHPMSGQTLAVHQLFPPGTTGGSLGNTGTDSRIEVFFGALPPSTALPTVPTASTASSPTTFTRYDKPRRLPTSLTLPCSGTGTAEFVPVPVVPPSQADAVPVQYVSRP